MNLAEEAVRSVIRAAAWRQCAKSRSGVLILLAALVIGSVR